MLNLVSTISAALLGQVTRNEEEFVTELRHVPEGWFGVGGLALLLAVCWAVVWMYRHEGRIGATVRVRMFLALVRCAVLVMLAVILLEPVRVRILRQWIDSYTIVLADTSSSMGLADTYRDETAKKRVASLLATDDPPPIRRAELLNHILGRADRQVLKALADNNRVKLYSFSDQPQVQALIHAGWEDDSPSGSLQGTAASQQRAASTPDGNAARRTGTPLVRVEDVSLTFTATGAATNIDRAVRRAVESLAGAPIAAIVVLSDGGFNQGASAEETARYARERRVPIYAIGIGDPSRPRNVRVVEAIAPENAFQNDPFSVSARLTAEGLDGETLIVQLHERDATGSGEGRIVDTRSVRVGPGGSIEPVTFERQGEGVGRHVYTIQVPVLESETVSEDNSRTVSVNVIEAQTRVLLIAGGPSWEYRFVTRLLQRDETFDVACWLQSADLSAVRDGNTVIDHLPVLAEELFEYDVVILMDPAPEEFDEPWSRLVDRLVTKYGGGLLYTAGRPHTPEFLRERSLKPLHDLLPVTLDPEADLVLNRIGHYQLHGAPLDIPRASVGHPIVQLGDDATATKLAWREMGDIHWHYPVRREKPAATVLMRHASPNMRNAYGGHVLAAVQYVGAGRTGFLAFDGTWRWRRYGTARFDRFWVQLIRFLAEGKLLGGSKRGMLLTESDNYSLGEAVTITARLFNARYEPLQRDQITARYTVDNEKTELVLTARADSAGWFEGRFVPDRTGSYRIRVELPGTSAAETIEVAREIRVSRPNIEILRPQMARAELVTLAEQSYGGRYFEMDQAHRVPELIPDLHAEIPIRSRPTSLWDNWISFSILIGLLTLEWAMRKWNRLL